jgi:hydroxyacylglutathione hydrolase
LYIHEDAYIGYKIITCIAKGKWQENCYMIVRDGKVVLIDPGFDCEEVITYIKTHGYNLGTIIITHAHHDHIASANVISEAFSLPCIVHLLDKKLLMHAPMYSMRFAKRQLKIPQNIRWLDKQVIDELLREGFDILHTPGHSHGGICIFFKNIVFSGDTIVKDYLGRTDLPEGNREQIIVSANKIFENIKAKNTSIIYPGHGTKWSTKEALQWWENGHKQYVEQKTF